MAIQVIEINGKHYTLLKQITTGLTSVVWKAALLDDAVPFGADVWPQQSTALRDRLLAPFQGSLDQPDGSLTLRAIKVPKTAEADKHSHQDQASIIQEEARRLARLSLERSVAHLVPKLYEPAVESAMQVLSLALNPELPLLVMEWVAGEQVDELAITKSEHEAVVLMRQLADALRNLRSIPITATDTVKPNSLFIVDGSLRLIDWNLIGRNPADFARITLPNVGQTAYRLMVGAGLRLDNDAMPIADTIGRGDEVRTWAQLSLYTRETICAMLTANLDRLERSGGKPCSGSKPNEVAASLCQAWTQQNDLWLMSPEELIERASGSGNPMMRLNCFDVAYLKLGVPMPDHVCDVYRQAALQWLDGLTRLSDIQLQLDWLRYRLPGEYVIRELWLIARLVRVTSMDEQKQLEQYREWAVAVQGNDLRRVLAMFEVVMLQNNESKALRLDIQLRLTLAELGNTVQQKQAEDCRRLLDSLAGTWRAIHDDLGEHAAPPLDDLEAKVDQMYSRWGALRKLIDAYQCHRKDFSDALAIQDFNAARNCVARLIDLERGLGGDSAAIERWWEVKRVLDAYIAERGNSSLQVLSAVCKGLRDCQNKQLPVKDESWHSSIRAFLSQCMQAPSAVKGVTQQ